MAAKLPPKYSICMDHALKNEIKITKQDNEVSLEPIDKDWDDFFDALSQFSSDFMEDGRRQPVGPAVPDMDEA